MSPEVRVVDATSDLQRVVSSACMKAPEQIPSSSSSLVSVKLEKGDYGIQAIQIPKNSKVTLFSKDRVRLIYVGKRNRPMFVLEENSSLFIKEKIEIYYNTNNIQEVMKLMIRKASPTANAEISGGVKISLFSRKTS